MKKNRQNDIRRSPLQLSNCKSNGKFEARNKIETVVASRVLMNMDLVQGENANRLRFFILGDSSSSASPPSVNQRSKWRLLVCLKQHASTKIHFRAKIFKEKTSHSEAEEKNKENTKAHHQALSYRGFTATKPYMQDSYARWLLKESTQLRSMCWHQENAMPRPGIQPGTFRSSVSLSQLSYRGPV